MTTNTAAKPDNITQDIEDAAEKLASTKSVIEQVILGQSQVVDLTLITLISGGHGLLVGLPGLAKTKLVSTIGLVCGLDSQRIQCTPDLMPSDILGSEILQQTETGERSFQFIKGPVFTNLLMADEINRASPRTQSALLQAMQEYEVTIAGQSHQLKPPFHVLATQNPLEQEGTYPLPEAQLDRFLMQIDVTYPDLETERQILFQTTTAEEIEPHQVLSASELMDIQKLITHMPVGEDLVSAILELVRQLRPDPEHAGSSNLPSLINWGPGPRASQALMMACRARALLQQRYTPNMDDIAAIARPILKHRMALSFEALADGVSLESVISESLSRVL